MKKPKLDLSKMKTLLVQHVEKIVFGIFVVVFLYFTYKGFTLEKFDKVPDDLTDEVTRATTHVSSSTFDRKREEMEFVDPTTTVAQNNVQIEATEFPLAPMNPLDFPPANKRGEPPYLPVEDLQVAASFGTFQLKPAGALPAGGAAAGGFAAKRWVCVTGLIPYDRQRRAYFEQLAKRGGGEPEWVAYRVERAELDVPGDAEPKWEVLSLAKSAAERATWASFAPETVAEEFRVPLPPAGTRSIPMLYPLGPRVGSTWTPEESNHPKILAIIAAETPAGSAPVAAGDAAAPAGAAAGAEKEGPAAPRAPGEVDIFGLDAAPAAAAPANKPAAAVAKPVRDMRVFRFFDFDVKPGKRYQYRVMLYLTNPNFGQETRDLTDPKLAVGPYRTTAFSSPSPPITVPHDAGVLLAGLERARGATEIGVRLIARQLTTDGATALARRTARRGEEINFRATPADDLAIVRPGRNGAAERPEEFNMRTDVLVVDILEAANAAGGAQARALLLGPDGRLVVKTQSGNAAEVAEAELEMTNAVEVAPAAPADEEPADKEKKEDRRRNPAPNPPGGDLLPPTAPAAGGR